jgi:hypothetical protein
VARILPLSCTRTTRNTAKSFEKRICKRIESDAFCGEKISKIHAFAAPDQGDLVCRRTENLRAVQLLLGHTKIESAVLQRLLTAFFCYGLASGDPWEGEMTVVTPVVMRGAGLCGALALALALPVGAAQAQSESYVMKFSTPTVNDVPDQFSKLLGTALEKDSGGRLKPEYFPASRFDAAADRGHPVWRNPVRCHPARVLLRR